MSAILPALFVFLQHMHHHGMDMAAAAAKGPDPYSLLNHHLAGIGLLLLAAFSYFDESRLARAEWRKYLWPALLGLIGIAVLGWSDPGTWPDGPKPLAQDIEAIQHKVFALLALFIAAVELFRRSGALTHKVWGYVFSCAVAACGVFLDFHQGQHTEVVHAQHFAMGCVAASMGMVKAWNNGGEVESKMRRYLPALLTAILGVLFLMYYEV